MSRRRTISKLFETENRDERDLRRTMRFSSQGSIGSTWDTIRNESLSEHTYTSKKRKDSGGFIPGMVFGELIGLGENAIGMVDGVLNKIGEKAGIVSQGEDLIGLARGGPLKSLIQDKLLSKLKRDGGIMDANDLLNSEDGNKINFSHLTYEPIMVGDVISLHTVSPNEGEGDEGEEGGLEGLIVQGDGFHSMHLGACFKSPSNQHEDSLFRILVKSNRSMAGVLSSGESVGSSGSGGDDHGEDGGEGGDQEDNEDEEEEDVVLNYGDPFLLQHLTSGRFLCVTTNIPLIEKDGLCVTLIPSSSPIECVFTFSSLYKSRLTGPIFVHDKVIFFINLPFMIINFIKPVK